MKREELVGLVRDSQAGCTWALFRVVACAWKRTASYVYRHCRDWHLAEDVAQEVTVKVEQHLAELQDPRAFNGWLRVIQKRELRDALRPQDGLRRRHGVPVSLEVVGDAGELSVTPGREGDLLRTDPLRQVENRQDSAQMLRLVSEACEAKYAEVLLRKAAGQSHEKIASDLGVTLDTIKMRAYHARRAMRRAVSATI